MKKYAIFLLSVVSFAAFGQSDQEVFVRANELYANHDYQAALTLYDAIESKGRGVWYNRGNCYAQLGKPADAILSWLRARPDATYQEILDIEHNIDRMSVDHRNVSAQWRDAHPVLRFISQKTLIRHDYFLLGALFVAGVVLFGLLLGVVLKRFFRPLFVFLISVMLLLQAGRLYYWKQQYALGVVMQNNIPVFTGPNDQFHKIHELMQTNIVSVLSCPDGWCKIRYIGNRGLVAGVYDELVEGWVTKSSIGIV